MFVFIPILEGTTANDFDTNTIKPPKTINFSCKLED